jgi:hypothetical protein
MSPLRGWKELCRLTFLQAYHSFGVGTQTALSLGSCKGIKNEILKRAPFRLGFADQRRDFPIGLKHNATFLLENTQAIVYQLASC